MRAVQRGPLVRLRSSPLTWAGRPFSYSDPATREGDFLLTPYGPLANTGNRERMITRRSADSLFRYLGRGEMPLDEDGIVCLSGGGNPLARSTFDGGTAGWNISAGVAGETTPDAMRYFDSSVEDTNVKIDQASPAVADRYVYQDIVWLWGGIGAITAAVGVVHLDSDEGVTIRIQRLSDNWYYNFTTQAWQAGTTGYVTPARNDEPTLDWAVSDFTTAGAETYRNWIVSPSGGTGGRWNRLYYAEHHGGGPYPTLPIQNLAAVSYGAVGRSSLSIPNYAGRRTFPADHGTLHVWVKTFWDFTDDLTKAGAVALGLVQHFGVFGCWHDTNNRAQIWIDQPNGTINAWWRCNGNDYTAMISPAAFGRDTGWSLISARWIGAAGELGLTPYTVDIFVDGVKGTSVVAEAMTEDDHSVVVPGSFVPAASTEIADSVLYRLTGTFRQLLLRYDCETDAEIAAHAAAGPGD